MIKVEVKNLKTNLIGWGSQFETQEQTNTWIASCVASNLWGKPEREVKEQWQVSLESGQEVYSSLVLDVDGSAVDVSGMTPIRTEKDFQDRDINVYLLPAEYEVIQTDISAQVEQAKKNDEFQKYLAETDWMIIRHAETGKEISEEVLVKRQAARDGIVKISQLKFT